MFWAFSKASPRSGECIGELILCYLITEVIGLMFAFCAKMPFSEVTSYITGIREQMTRRLDRSIQVTINFWHDQLLKGPPMPRNKVSDTSTRRVLTALNG